MDPFVIAAGALALLRPYLVKAADVAATEAGKKVWGLTDRLWTALRAKFAGDEEATATLDGLADDPAAAGDETVEALAGKLDAHPDLLAEVAALVEEAKANPQLSVVQDVVEAQRVEGLRARRIGGSRDIRVEQKVAKADEVVGVVVDDLE